jgi:MFS family permease
MSLRPYLELMGDRRVLRVFLASLIGRLPMGMMAVAIVLFTQESTDSLAAAGLASGAYAISIAACTPIQGRMIDRIGSRPVLLTLVAFEAVALVALVVAGTASAPSIVLIVLAAAAGAGRPALAPSVRSLLRDIVSKPDHLDRVFALEGTVVELLYTIGPLLTAGVVAIASPAAALITAACLSAVGTVAFVTASATSDRGAPPVDGGKRHIAGALRSVGVRTTTLTALTMGLTFGCIEVGTAALAIEEGHPALAGVALGANAVGSLIAGFWYGSKKWNSSRQDRYRLCSLAFAIGFLPLAVVSSVPAATVLLLLAGFALAPLSITAFLIIDEVAAEENRTEAYAWASTAIAAGAAIGGSVAGILSGATSAQAALVAAAAGAVGAGLIGAVRYNTIGPKEQMA